MEWWACPASSAFAGSVANGSATRAPPLASAASNATGTPYNNRTFHSILVLAAWFLSTLQICLLPSLIKILRSSRRRNILHHPIRGARVSVWCVKAFTGAGTREENMGSVRCDRVPSRSTRPIGLDVNLVLFTIQKIPLPPGCHISIVPSGTFCFDSGGRAWSLNAQLQNWIDETDWHTLG